MSTIFVLLNVDKGSFWRVRIGNMGFVGTIKVEGMRAKNRSKKIS